MKRWNVKGGTIVLVAIVLCLIVMPAVGGLTYQYGGKYYHEAYPLEQSAVWILTAQGSAGQAPVYAHPAELAQIVEEQASRGWAYLNQSDNATGVGMGSPCWLFAQPTQTYAYPNIMLKESFGYLANLSGGAEILNNTQFQAAFSEVYNLLGNAGNSMVTNNPAQVSSIEGCIWDGQVSWYYWAFSDLALFAGLMVLAGLKGKGRRAYRAGWFEG